ncbi:MAG: hypothetical protein AMXMBFR64_56260 [Myxococcales bacterium]
MVGHRLKLAAALVAAALVPACADDEPSTPTGDATQDAGDGTTDVPTADTGHEDTGATPDVPDTMADTAPDTSADVPTDTGTAADSGTDTGEPFVPTGAFKDLKALPVDAFHDIPGLTGRVDVTIDEWGIPHILAESVEDAMRVDGWLVARDRFPQMEMIRRSTGGTLSKLGGLLDDGIIEDDIFARVMGFRRLAEQDWANLTDGSLEKRVLDAYAAGVNAYLDRLRAGDAQVPPELAVLINVSTLEDWSPVDSLVLARYQIWRLSFDAESEVGYTKRRVGADAVYRADSDDPKLAARAGILADLGGWAPADPAIQYPGFPPPDLSPNPLPPGAAPVAPGAALWTAPAPEVLDLAQDFLRGFKSPWNPLSGAAKGASNSWIVSASKSATGNALLANDPHLDNDSPALFYQAHIVVEPRDEASGPPLDFVGAGFPGLPGVLIGHNQDVAWGLTTASYDYTDAFVEQLVWGEGDLPKVMRNGAEVDLEVFEETIEIGVAGNVTETITVKIPWVPGRGPLSPVIKGKTLTIPKEATAISYGWRGFQPSPEITFLVQLLSAKDLADVQEALESWVLGSQNLVFAFRDGTIFSSGQSYIPERPAAAKTWDPDTNPGGWAPWWTLDGTGQHDWVGAIDRSRVPHAVDPPAGYVVAANNDQVGVTLDGDPLNDYDYIGYDYDVGFRAGRIERMLKERLDQGPLTLQDMSDIQLDVRSNQGERLTPFLLAAADALLAEYDAPGTHPGLTALAEAHPGAKDRVAELRSLLAGWDFTAEDGVWGTPTEAQKLAATQTSLFNAWTVALLARAFNDERNAAPGFGFREQQAVSAAIRLLESPGDARTLDPQTGESALWDDLTTEETETSTAILAAALFEADAKLTELFGGADTTTWLWGKLHTKSFESIIPSLAGGVSPFDWPQPGQGWDSGYPRRGDSFNVNVCHGGYGDYDFKCGSGPIMRFIAEMTPEGPVSWNTIPGGQVWDTKSKHFTDLLQLWLDSERHPFLTRPADVATSVETHLAFTP